MLPKPPKDYYCIEEVAEEWGWSVEDIISYGEQGKLEILGKTIHEEQVCSTNLAKVPCNLLRPFIVNYRERNLIISALSKGVHPPTGLFIAHQEKKHFEENISENKLPSKINPAEKKSLLKIIYAMAVGGYSYDPKVSKSLVPKEISEDAAKVDFSIHPDTVRKWLKEASKLEKDEM